MLGLIRNLEKELLERALAAVLADEKAAEEEALEHLEAEEAGMRLLVAPWQEEEEAPGPVVTRQ